MSSTVTPKATEINKSTKKPSGRVLQAVAASLRPISARNRLDAHLVFELVVAHPGKSAATHAPGRGRDGAADEDDRHGRRADVGKSLGAREDVAIDERAAAAATAGKESGVGAFVSARA